MGSVDDTEVLARLLIFLPLDDAARWLSSPQVELGGRIPDELMGEGRKVEVHRAIDALVDGRMASIETLTRPGIGRYPRSSRRINFSAHGGNARWVSRGCGKA